MTNGFLPEFGRASGGLVNVVTKSGTNQFDGTAFTYFRDRSLNARNAFEVERAPFGRQQAGAALGGPIVRNRAHFFGNFEAHRINTQKFVNTRGAFPQISFADVPMCRCADCHPGGPTWAACGTAPVVLRFTALKLSREHTPKENR